MAAWGIENYDRERAQYSEDVIAFVKETQPDAWDKLSKQYPKDPEKALLDSVSRQLGKADPNGTAKELRKYGTLWVLHHPIKDRGAHVRQCLAQFPFLACCGNPNAHFNGERFASVERFKVLSGFPCLANHAKFKISFGLSRN